MKRGIKFSLSLFLLLAVVQLGWVKKTEAVVGTTCRACGCSCVGPGVDCTSSQCTTGEEFSCQTVGGGCKKISVVATNTLVPRCKTSGSCNMDADCCSGYKCQNTGNEYVCVTVNWRPTNTPVPTNTLIPTNTPTGAGVCRACGCSCAGPGVDCTSSQCTTREEFSCQTVGGGCKKISTVATNTPVPTTPSCLGNNEACNSNSQCCSARCSREGRCVAAVTPEPTNTTAPAASCPVCSKGNFGDADISCDGKIGIGDYNVWINEYIKYQSGVRQTSWRSDFNCDGKPGIDDYDRWINNYLHNSAPVQPGNL